MNETDWEFLNIPIILKCYLKHMIHESHSLSMTQMLECEFNNGNDLDWKSYETRVQEILKHGYTRDQALEAVIVAPTLDEAARYLEKTPKNKYDYKEKAIAEKNHKVEWNKHNTIVVNELSYFYISY